MHICISPHLHQSTSVLVHICISSHLHQCTSVDAPSVGFPPESPEDTCRTLSFKHSGHYHLHQSSCLMTQKGPSRSGLWKFPQRKWTWEVSKTLTEAPAGCNSVPAICERVYPWKKDNWGWGRCLYSLAMQGWDLEVMWGLG